MFYSPSPNRRKSWLRLLTVGHKKLMVAGSLVLVLFVVMLSVLGVYAYRAMQYDMSRVGAGLVNNSLFDSQGCLIASLAADDACVVSREELPQHLINAFVAREDERFFEHNGVVISSVLRSVLRNLKSMRYEQGASTITMQLTRNVYELSGKSMDRKMLEAMLAQRIERHFDKYTILQQYLSRIFYGQNCYGVKAAARHYFGKSVCELNLVECATLAGLVRAPSLFNPITSMENAMQVKKETLQRMLECEMITQEEYHQAVQNPIVLRRGTSAQDGCSSYSVMWARHELEGIQSEVPEHSGGISVVSSLNLSLQQYVENAVEAALTAVERPGAYPEAWLKDMTPEMADATRTAYSRLRRPEGLKVRGANNDLKGLLQCCALVVDARRNQRGKILALVGGRSAVDGIDRWQGKVRPGRAAAPFLFCCACLPGGEDMHIVARSTEVTGERLGYDVVRSFYESLKLRHLEIPEREQALYLYNGMFQMRRLDLARLLFCLQNEGRGYRLSMVNAIWNSNRQLIYNYEPEKSPEYIRRESATAISSLPPFRVTEGEPVTMNETLPEGCGQWTMVFRNRGVCTFVWMGFDDASHPLATARELRPLLSRASMNLAREIFDKARAELRAQQQKTEAAKPTPAS
ncbi:MAG: transglycosylase domain-containing protein [Akkermansia sp.]|nr:transglycosylase domain-containing protein [Akkermansia sp.]